MNTQCKKTSNCNTTNQPPDRETQAQVWFRPAPPPSKSWPTNYCPPPPRTVRPRSPQFPRPFRKFPNGKGRRGGKNTLLAFQNSLLLIVGPGIPKILRIQQVRTISQDTAETQIFCSVWVEQPISEFLWILVSLSPPCNLLLLLPNIHL